MVATLDENMTAYEELRGQLESKHMGEWVLIHDRQLIGTYSDFQTVASTAVKRFGRGPYHIKRIGEPPIKLPPALMFGITHEIR